MPPSLKSSLLVALRMTCRAVLMSLFAMLVSRGRVMLRVFMLSERVMMRGLMMMVRSSMVMRGRFVMMVLGRVFGCLWHIHFSSSS